MSIGAVSFREFVTESRNHTELHNRSDYSKEVETMDLNHNYDEEGPYFQWGDTGEKFHYNAEDQDSRTAAKTKAEQYGRDMRASGYEVKPGITTYKQPPPPPQPSG